MEKKKKPRYQIYRNPRTGKITKTKYEEFEDEFENEESQGSSSSTNTFEVLKTLDCPYQFDNPEVYEKLSTRFKKAKFTVEVDVEIALSAEQEEEHTHQVFLECDKNQFEAGADLSKYEFDIGMLFCGLYYKLEPKVTIGLKNAELIEDKEIENFKDKIVEESKKITKDWKHKPKEFGAEEHNTLFFQMKEYFDKHLVNELKRVTEKLAFEIHTLNEQGDEREKSIRIILGEEETELRRRLETAKGRKSAQKQTDYSSEKEKFIKDCFKAFQEITKNRRKITRTELTKINFKLDSNPYQALRRKLDTFGLTFEEILAQFSEQKSSRKLRF